MTLDPTHTPELGVDETLVFVYGTLLQGECNHTWLQRARFLGRSSTRHGYDLRDLGSFPALVEGGGSVVHGEIYACDRRTLLGLDEIEDCPDFYYRGAIELDDGRTALAYLLPRGSARHFPVIESGDWRERR